MSALTSYSYTCSGYQTYIPPSNTLSGSQFFTAANASSTNSNLGSSAALNWGYGVLLLAPSLTKSGVPTIAYSANTPMQGSGIVFNPSTGQTLSSYKVNLPTTDSTTVVEQIGGLIITNSTATISSFTAMNIYSNNLTLSNNMGPYFTANATSIAITVPMSIAGITSNTIISGVSSSSKFQVYFSNGPPMLSVDTTNGILLLGNASSTTYQAQTTLAGFLNITGESYTNKFAISVTTGQTSTTYLNLDTISSILSVAVSQFNVALTDGLTISGANNIDKFLVQNSSGATTFQVDTDNGYVVVGGTDSDTAYKFQVLNSNSQLVFGVQTNASTTNAQTIQACTIIPASVGGPFTLGTTANPWNIYGTIVGGSDRRLKKLEPTTVSDAEALRFVRGIDVQTFRYLAQIEQGNDRKMLGLITDEVYRVSPEVADVIVTKGPTEGICLYSLIGVLAKAIKYLAVEK